MLMTDLTQEYVDWRREQSTWEEQHAGRLAVSEIGKCPRMAMLRITGVERTNPFDEYMRRLLFSGEMAEAKAKAPLLWKYGDDVQSQVVLEAGAWVGKPDFLVPGHVIEHKETGENRFKYGDMPFRFHVLQVLMYQWMIEQVEGYKPEALLYYQQRANQAEYRVWEWGDRIGYEGHVNGKEDSGILNTTLEFERAELEKWFAEGEVPPRYDTPFEKNYTCCRLYPNWKRPTAYPSCGYFDHCWPEYAGQKSLTIPEGT